MFYNSGKQLYTLLLMRINLLTSNNHSHKVIAATCSGYKPAQHQLVQQSTVGKSSQGQHSTTSTARHTDDHHAPHTN